jgi:proton-dependent oligopeptide transporter, POT family
LTFSERLQEIRTGFERPFWIANFTEIFERLSYYGAYAALAIYLHERLHFSTQQTGTLTGIFGFVWILAPFGGAVADRMGFRRALATAYLILSVSYFLLGSIEAPWMASVRSHVSLAGLVGFILLLPAFGIALVKPCVVGTTSRASKENVRSIGFSIYYTMVNVGGFLGPFLASWIDPHLGVENVFRVAAVSVFAMFFVVLFFFPEPRKIDDAPPPSIATVARNFCLVVGKAWLVLPALAVALALRVAQFVDSSLTVPWWAWIAVLALLLAGSSRFMWFLVLFTGYWVVFWQQYISLPGFIHAYVNQDANVELILVTDGLTVICLTLAINYLTRKIPAFQAVILGTVITSLAWLVLAFWPTVPGAIASLFVLALGEIIQSPRYYEYISRLAPPGQQGTYMGFAFLPIGIGSLIGGWFGGSMVHHFGEVTHQPARIWICVTAVGMATAVVLWIYDRVVRAGTVRAGAAS